ncbi:MAG: carboxypeptidase-like regulatory domain-containing protein [Bryobacteraceae bacterium]
MLLALALSVSAQDVNKATLRYEIHGVVLETGTNQPILDAKVTLYFLGSEKPRVRTGLKTQKILGETTTDFLGAFVFRPDEPGYYGVDVKKDGYTAGAGSSQYLTLTTEEPNREVRLFLAHPGEITGRVVDAETQKPIPNVTVRAWAARSILSLARGRGRLYGRPGFGSGSESITDLNGRFRLSERLPGSWIMEIVPRTRGKKRVTTEFSESDLELVDEDVENTYWPGGTDPESTVPVTLASGAIVDVGERAVKKAQYYRVHVEVPGGICKSEETLIVSEEALNGRLDVARDVPCGKDFLISGFSPGSHRLIFYTNTRPATLRTASVPFSITDKNVTVTVPLAYGVTVDARFVAADGAQPPDFTRLALFLNGLDCLSSPDHKVPAGADGRLRVTNVPFGRHEAIISGVGTDRYVKEILYNGTPRPDNVISVGDDAGGRSLTIVIDDKPATVNGIVTEGGTPVSEPFVTITKWPILAEWLDGAITKVRGDDKGRFSFNGLAPGEYRVVAFASSTQYAEYDQATLRRIIETSQKLELGPRALKNLTLELWKPE